MKSAAAGFPIMRDAEYLFDIDETMIGINSYTLNPGLSSFFPWTSGIAMNFQKYVLSMLEVKYIPACATDQNADIGFAFEYNNNELDPTTFAELSQYSGFSVGPVWNELTLKYEGKRTPLYTTNLESPVGDSNLYHAGRLIVYFRHSTPPESGFFGRVYVKYRMHLMIPQVPTSAAVQLAELQNTSVETKTLTPGEKLIVPMTITKNDGSLVSTDDSDLLVKPGTLRSTATISAECSESSGATGKVHPSFFAQVWDEGLGAWETIVDSIVDTRQVDSGVGLAPKISLASQTLLQKGAPYLLRYAVENLGSTNMDVSLASGALSMALNMLEYDRDKKVQVEELKGFSVAKVGAKINPSKSRFREKVPSPKKSVLDRWPHSDQEDEKEPSPRSRRNSIAQLKRTC